MKLTPIGIVALTAVFIGCATEYRSVNAPSNNQDATSVEEIVVTSRYRVEARQDIPAAVLSESKARLAPDHYLYLHGIEQDRENYLDIKENDVKLVSTEPLSTFSIDVDTASYSNVRRFLERNGALPPQDAVKLEEMVNYFSYDYPTPDNLDQPFR